MHLSSMLATMFMTLLFACFATIVMSYISLAVPIGPWIEPTLVLLGIILARLCMRRTQMYEKEQGVALATIAGGISGIVASACAWSFPALYFLDQALFTTWLQQPITFAAYMGATVFLAGGAGLVSAYLFEKQLLRDTTMPFPVAQMLYKTIAAQNQVRKGYELLLGAISSISLSMVQKYSRFIPQKITLMTAHTIGWWELPAIAFRLDIVPMLWAIGFITGHVIAIPFAVGAVLKIIIIGPLHTLLFSHIHPDNFLLALCCGIVVQGALMSFVDAPKFISKLVHYVRYSFATRSIPYTNVSLHRYIPLLGAMLLALVLFFSWLAFSSAAQLFILVGTVLCAYQLMILMGKIGLAPLGRFATFVMLPGLVFFGFTALQATIVSAFVEISGGVAADALSGAKLGQLANIAMKYVRTVQWFALCVTAVLIGAVFWLLIHQFGLGSVDLIAQKAQSRALLINAYDFDAIAILIGIALGFVLKMVRVNASLVLGGLLMSIDWSLILVASGLTTYLMKDKEAYYPFWSGVFAASSIVMLLKALL